LLALNALGNVVAGLLGSLPDAEDKMEWFCTHMMDNCYNVLKKREERKSSVTLQ
jgi:hypothetical protein